jgi:hypothetical protein
MEPIERVIAALNAFVPQPHDFQNTHRLHEVLSGFGNLPQSDRAKAIPAIFALMERHPEAEFGSPGPLVHEVEAIDGYERELALSLHRQPSLLTVWMVNRILNSELLLPVRAAWLAELHAVAEHPRAPESAKNEAVGFIKFQGEAGV